MNTQPASVRHLPVGHLALLSYAALALTLLLAIRPAHTLAADALIPLTIAAIFDALTGTIPIIALAVAVLGAGAFAWFDDRIPYLAIAIAPLAFYAWRTREEAIGWGDVLAIFSITVLLPLWPALAVIVVGTGTSLLVTRLRRQRSERLTPYLVFAAACALWLVR